MTIPTPFIGGTGGQEGDRRDKKDMEPPFFPEDAAEDADEPQAKPVPETLEPEETLADIEILEAEGPELAGLAEPEDDLTAETGEEISEMVLDDLAAAIEPAAGEPPIDFEAAPEAEPVASTAAPDSGFGVDDQGFPDFLEGPDDAEPEVPEPPMPAEISEPPLEVEETPVTVEALDSTLDLVEPPAETAASEAPVDDEESGEEWELPEDYEPPFTVDEVTAMAARLMTSDYGDWIIKLTQDLGPVADETTILGAFSAGYLASMADMQKEEEE